MDGWNSDELLPVSVDILGWKTLTVQRELLRVLLLLCAYMANEKMRFKLSAKLQKRIDAIHKE